MSETIHTVHIDFIASVLADLSSRLGLGWNPPWDVPGLEWLQARIGTDDLPDAYRQLPVSPSQQGFFRHLHSHPRCWTAFFPCSGVWLLGWSQPWSTSTGGLCWQSLPPVGVHAPSQLHTLMMNYLLNFWPKHDVSGPVFVAFSI